MAAAPPAAAPGKAAAAAPPAATAPSKAAAAAGNAAAGKKTSTQEKADLIAAELDMEAPYTVAEALERAEHELGLKPEGGATVGQRLEKAYREILI